MNRPAHPEFKDSSELVDLETGLPAEHPAVAYYRTLQQERSEHERLASMTTLSAHRGPAREAARKAQGKIHLFNAFNRMWRNGQEHDLTGEETVDLAVHNLDKVRPLGARERLDAGEYDAALTKLAELFRAA